MQSNNLMKSTLMFNVLPGTEISVHAEFSHCRQNCYCGLQAMCSSMALKSGESVHIWTTTARKWGSVLQDPHRIATTGLMLASKHYMIPCLFLYQLNCANYYTRVNVASLSELKFLRVQLNWMASEQTVQGMSSCDRPRPGLGVCCWLDHCTVLQLSLYVTCQCLCASKAKPALVSCY